MHGEHLKLLQTVSSILTVMMIFYVFLLSTMPAI